MTKIENGTGQQIDPHEAILKLLDTGEVVYRLIDHEPVYTSQKAEEMTGLKPSQGAKALLLSTGADFVLAVLPGDKRVDFKKIATLLGVKKVKFAGEDEVQTVMHCGLGACYPFGSVVNVRTIVDPLLQQEEEIAFNPGVNEQSIIINGADYFEIEKPEVVSIIKE